MKPVAPRPAAAADDEPLPALPPRIERRAAQASPRKGPKDLAGVSWVDAGHLALSSPGRLEIVDLAKTTSVVLTTGARIRDKSIAGARLVTLDESSRIVVWDLGAEVPPRAWQAPPVQDRWSDPRLAVSPGGERIAYSNETVVKVWDAETGKELFSVPREVPTFQLVVTRDEVVATSNNVRIEAWRIDDGKSTATASFDTGATFGMVVSSDTRWGAAGSPSGHGLQVSEIRRSGTLRLLVDSTDCSHHVGPSFSADGRYVYAYLGSDWIKGFETGTWKPYASYRAEPGREIRAAAEDLARVLTTRDDAEPALVVVSTKKATPLERPFGAGAGYAFNDDGSLLVGGNDQHEARVWSAKTAKVVFEVAPE